MKKTIVLLTGIFLFNTLMAQIPQGINHQAAIRDSEGELVTNTAVGIQVSILQGSLEGPVIYSETHITQSNLHGLVSYVIGKGENPQGHFDQIDWAEGPYFLQMKADPAGGTNYSWTVEEQLLSVPYAMHALTTNDSFDGDMAGEQIINIGDPAEEHHAVPKEFADYLESRIETLEDALDADLPELTTTPAFDITISTAKSGGKITSDGGSPVTARGIVWSTQENPTIEENEGITSEGVGTGEFTSELLNLVPEMQYFVRAYATNIIGTSYGNQVSFTTHADYTTPGDGMTDIDGNEYTTVIIGDFEVIAENLRTTKYHNGDPIPTGLSNDDWRYTSDGAYAIYSHHLIDGLGSPEEVVDAYGKLYNWYAVDDSRGLCPDGWEVLSDTAWTVIEDYVVHVHDEADEDNVSNLLKSCRQVNSPLGGECDTENHPRWDQWAHHFGTDNFGFSALPAGFRSRTGGYNRVGEFGQWWTSTEESENQAWRRGFSRGTGSILRNNSTKNFGFAIRCGRMITDPELPSVTTAEVTDIGINSATSGGDVTDDGGAAVVNARGIVWSNSPNPTIDDHIGMTGDGAGLGEFTSQIDNLAPESTYYVRAYASNIVGVAYGEEKSFTTEEDPDEGTVTDIDGNVYETVVIGDQEWMAENLRVTRYNNGDDIPEGLGNATGGAFGVYPYQDVEGIDSSEEMVEAYGKLYNWMAVTDDRGLCPEGWHTPSESAWTELTNYLIDNYHDITEENAGNALKDCRQVNSPLGGECDTAEHPRWDEDNDHFGTDEFDFGALPAGIRTSGDGYFQIGKGGIWWSSTPWGSGRARFRMIQENSGEINPGDYWIDTGASIRCMRVVPEKE